jgi:hypothetical protein
LIDVIDLMNLEATRRKYLSLAVCVGYPDGRESLIHHIDTDRREQFNAAIAGGAIPVGVFWILHCEQFGYVAGCRQFSDDPAWKHVFDRELAIMKKLLGEDPTFRNVVSERNPVIH